MAVQPLNKTKIIKKVKKHANRYHSDRYFRVGVSFTFSSAGQCSTEQLALIHTVLNFLLFRPPGELLAVSTHVSDADLREEYEAQRLEESKTLKLDIN